MNWLGLRGHLIHYWNTQAKGLRLRCRGTESSSPPFPATPGLQCGLLPPTQREVEPPDPALGPALGVLPRGLASPGLLHSQVKTAVLGSLVWARGTSAVPAAGLLLHLGWGEPGGGGRLPTSCREGEGEEGGLRGAEASGTSVPPWGGMHPGGPGAPEEP